MIKIVILSFIFGYYVMLHIYDRVEQRRFSSMLENKGHKKLPTLLFYNFLEPFVIRLSGVIARKTPFKTMPQKLIWAGKDEILPPERFLAYQAILTLIFGAVGFLFGGPFWAAILMVAGLLYPFCWLRREICKRREEIINTFPNIVDVLTLSVEAGLDFISAISRLVMKHRSNALVFELEKMLSEIKIGLSRGEALKRFSQRCNASAITSFASLLIQADRLGSSIGPILRAQSDKLRYERFQRAERGGVIAAQKVLVPLVFFIMPAVFIVIFGPILINVLTNGFGL